MVVSLYLSMRDDIKAEIRMRLDAIASDIRGSNRRFSNIAGYIREIKELLNDL